MTHGWNELKLGGKLENFKGKPKNGQKLNQALELVGELRGFFFFQLVKTKFNVLYVLSFCLYQSTCRIKAAEESGVIMSHLFLFYSRENTHEPLFVLVRTPGSFFFLSFFCQWLFLSEALSLP